jgi:hypothetical protein
MIEELIHYLGIRCASRSARCLGYAYEAAALQSRHRRCRHAWHAHIQASQQALLDAAAQTCDGGTALIIGGGTCYDLPLSALLQQFEQIILLDIVFSVPPRRLARRWPQRLRCCYHDITGCVEALARARGLPLKQPSVALPPHLPPITWAASVNCLTQLPLLPMQWLRRHQCDEQTLSAFGAMLIKTHLDWLAACSFPVCLISEVEEQHYRQDGSREIRDLRPLLQSWPQHGEAIAQWSWLLHPPGELPRGQWQTRTVQAWLKPALPARPIIE